MKPKVEEDGEYWTIQHKYRDKKNIPSGWVYSNFDNIASVRGIRYLSDKTFVCWTKFGERGFLDKKDAIQALDHVRHNDAANLPDDKYKTDFRIVRVKIYRAVMETYGD